MKNLISICLIFFIILNTNLLQSQENNFIINNNTSLEIVTPDYLSIYEDGYAIIGFKKNR